MSDILAELRLHTQESRDDIPFFTRAQRMGVDMICSVDDPQGAMPSGHRLRMRAENGATEAAEPLWILRSAHLRRRRGLQSQRIVYGWTGGANGPVTVARGLNIELETA
ncbi:hypothetical protein [Sedimentitalea nanhaiensis]|uniref:Uncharacterized protein n=1 Tax=Sedimentitalea nanhaiensis TaxID=999627 RepID=A0A1I7DBD5_9RHOB|nr:hypothetical protein [Sedimentitalea nanhaiensis]SFU08924.1 hypothetical protein SAMN05216236_12550 [Sedimentitalea nanhaiensis]